MDADPEGPEETVLIPFPSCSVNLLAGPSSVGKTHFLKHILSNLSFYYKQSVNHIIVVHCNNIVPIYKFEIPLTHSFFEQITLEEFDPSRLEENDLVIFEDLQVLTKDIRDTINLYAHHSHLASVFLVTHSLLGNSELFSLIGICHRVLFFLRAVRTGRQAYYVATSFFQDEETRRYLKKIFGFVERQKNILLLEINPLASQPVQHLALSHLSQLTEGYCLVYPHLGNLSEFQEKYPPAKVQRGMADAFRFGPETTFPPNTYVAVPAESLLAQKKAGPEEEESEGPCAEREDWNEAVARIEEMVEHYVKANKLFQAKNLLREILSRPDFCITRDGRSFHLKRTPRAKASLLDYLTLATRRAGPMEQVLSPDWQVYADVTKYLLDRGAPRSLFSNKLLMSQ